MDQLSRLLTLMQIMALVAGAMPQWTHSELGAALLIPLSRSISSSPLDLYHHRPLSSLNKNVRTKLSDGLARHGYDPIALTTICLYRENWVLPHHCFRVLAAITQPRCTSVLLLKLFLLLLIPAVPSLTYHVHPAPIAAPTRSVQYASQSILHCRCVTIILLLKNHENFHNR